MCRFWFSRSGRAWESVFPTSLQMVWLLLDHDPHIQLQCPKGLFHLFPSNLSPSFLYTLLPDHASNFSDKIEAIKRKLSQIIHMSAVVPIFSTFPSVTVYVLLMFLAKADSFTWAELLISFHCLQLLSLHSLLNSFQLDFLSLPLYQNYFYQDHHWRSDFYIL